MKTIRIEFFHAIIPSFSIVLVVVVTVVIISVVVVTVVVISVVVVTVMMIAVVVVVYWAQEGILCRGLSSYITKHNE